MISYVFDGSAVQVRRSSPPGGEGGEPGRGGGRGEGADTRGGGSSRVFFFRAWGRHSRCDLLPHSHSPLPSPRSCSSRASPRYRRSSAPEIRRSTTVHSLECVRGASLCVATKRSGIVPFEVTAGGDGRVGEVIGREDRRSVPWFVSGLCEDFAWSLWWFRGVVRVGVFSSLWERG
jgi:hypothetical protein